MVHQKRRTTKKNFFVNKGKREENLTVGLINIQGPTKVKLCELEKLTLEHNIMCVTETQQKYLRVNISDNIGYLESNRNINDRNGGGLCILYRKTGDLMLEKINTKHSDILQVKCTQRSVCYFLILVYMSTNDQERNKVIECNINPILNTLEENN